MIKRLSMLSGLLLLNACTTKQEVEPWGKINDEQYAQLSDLDKDGVILARDRCNYTKDGRTVDNSGCSSEKERLLKQDYEVQFLQEQFSLENEEKQRFIRFLAKLPKEQKWYFKIEGLASDDSDILYNQVKSKRRVEYIKALIEAQNLSLAAPIHSKVFSTGDQVVVYDAIPENTHDADLDSVEDKFDQCDDTPANFYVDEQGCPILEDRLVEYSLSVRYGHNSSDIESIYVPKIEQLAEFIINYNVQHVNVVGHTSAPGSDIYNRELSLRRARSVKKLLVEHYNIDVEKVTTSGKGETMLLEEGDSDEIHTLNRRVDIELSEVLTIERMRNVDADNVVETRNVYIQAESTESISGDKWHIYIMDKSPQLLTPVKRKRTAGW